MDININLQVPIWTIHHVAAAFHLSVDTAREYTYRSDFPAPKDSFAKNIWAAKEVLDWFDNLPTRSRSTRSPHAAGSRTTVRGRSAGSTLVNTAAEPKRLKVYTPRSSR